MIFVGLQFIILGAYFCSETEHIFNFILTIMIQGFGEGSSSLVFPVIYESYSVSEEEKYRLQGVVNTIQNFSLAIGPAIGESKDNYPFRIRTSRISYWGRSNL